MAATRKDSHEPPRGASQSTREILLDGKPMRTSPRAEPAAARPRTDSRAAATRPVPPAAAPTLTDSSSEPGAASPSEPAVERGLSASPEWPPAVTDYSSGDAGETVQEPRGISARDLAGLSPDVTPPHGAARPTAPTLPDPWAEPGPAWQPPDPDDPMTPTPRVRVDPPPSGPQVTPSGLVRQPAEGPAAVTGSIDLPGDDIMSSAQGTEVRQQTPQRAESTTDHVSIQPRPSSGKVILIAAVAASLILGLGLVVVLSLTAGRHDSRSEGPLGPRDSDTSAAPAGSLLIRTTPAAGCTVFVNDAPTGLIGPGTTLRVSELSAGKYKVSVRCVGFEPYDESVQVKNGEATPVKAALKREYPRRIRR